MIFTTSNVLIKIYKIVLIFRDFENLVLAAKTVGGEVGDQNHSRGFPPRVVDCGYKIFTEKLERYFGQPVAGLPFPLPFSVIVDKDQSHHRKRTLVGIRVINLERESMGTLQDIVYAGHPASID